MDCWIVFFFFSYGFDKSLDTSYLVISKLYFKAWNDAWVIFITCNPLLHKTCHSMLCSLVSVQPEGQNSSPYCHMWSRTGFSVCRFKMRSYTQNTCRALLHMTCFVAAHLFWDLFPEGCSQEFASCHLGMAGAGFCAVLNLYCAVEVSTIY